MFDPLSAAPAPAQQQQGSATSPPATPSKSRITSRPPPYVRPVAGTSAGASSVMSQSTGPSSSLGQFANDSNQQYTSTVRSQSPLAPRPPLPGQIQRPVSPIQWSQNNAQQETQQQYQQHNSLSPQNNGWDNYRSAPTAPIAPTPTSPNAWSSAATSPPRSAAIQGMSQQQQQQQAGLPYLGGGMPAPVPLPQPVPGIAGPQPTRPLNSPGIPRSPVAESPTRSLHASMAGANGQSQYATHQNHPPPQQQQQQAKVPPFIRIRVTGIDRAKKELGVKMDAQTNIPTYHRRQSPIFERTYNEFASLHGALSANHPETILPAIPLPQTSATSEDEEDRFLKGVFQKFIDRITRDRAVILDDELRSFVEADFGYTPLTRAKKLKSGSGFLSRSSSKPLLGDDGEPDFLVTSKVQSAALETALMETCKSLEKVLRTQATCASSYADLGTAVASFATTETHQPLTEGMKALSEAITHVAQLETGQANATALVLGDSLAYEACEARSAKDALLQRQYNADELRNSIKTTINKRRGIEKLRASGSIKPERVNEALDDLEEAAKTEQTLQHRVEAISRNLRPALQTHLRIMNDDMLSIALGQARTMLAYENRKLQIYENTHKKILSIPERGANDQNVVYYHQPAAGATDEASNGSSSSTAAAGPSAAPAAGVPPAHVSAGMSPATSQQSQGSASMIPGVASTMTTGAPQSKFMATQAAIQAELLAQREREERQRAQFAQARAYQHQKQASVGQAASNVAPQPQLQKAHPKSQEPAPSISASISGMVPASISAASGLSTKILPSPSQQSVPEHASNSQHTRQGARPDASMAQSMFVSPQLRSPPRSPSTHGRVVSQSAAPASSSSTFGTADPLSGDPLGPSNGPVPGMVQQYQRQGGPLDHGHSAGMNGGANMTQSVFLPGRNAQPGIRPAQASNPIEERKRMDARKAANMLAGAF